MIFNETVQSILIFTFCMILPFIVRGIVTYYRSKSQSNINTVNVTSDKGIEKLTKLIDRDPDNYLAFVQRAEVYTNMKKYEDAAADYNKAIKLNPYDINSYKNLTKLNIAQKVYSHSVTLMDRAINLDYDNPELYFLRGEAFFKMNKFDYALQDFKEAGRRNMNTPDLFRYRGLSYLELNDYENAVNDMKKAIEMNAGFKEELEAKISEAQNK